MRISVKIHEHFDLPLSFVRRRLTINIIFDYYTPFHRLFEVKKKKNTIQLVLTQSYTTS